MWAGGYIGHYLSFELLEISQIFDEGKGWIMVEYAIKAYMLDVATHLLEAGTSTPRPSDNLDLNDRMKI